MEASDIAWNMILPPKSSRLRYVTRSFTHKLINIRNIAILICYMPQYTNVVLFFIFTGDRSQGFTSYWLVNWSHGSICQSLSSSWQKTKIRNESSPKESKSKIRSDVRLQEYSICVSKYLLSLTLQISALRILGIMHYLPNNLTVNVLFSLFQWYFWQDSGICNVWLWSFFFIGSNR